MVASDVAHQLARFGTAEGGKPPRELQAGPLRCLLLDGALRSVMWHGVEVLRALDYPVRDENWGTYALQVVGENGLDTENTGLSALQESAIRYSREFTVSEGTLNGKFNVSIEASGVVTAEISFTASGDFWTNRAGFSILHPIRDVAGTKMRVGHSDGSNETLHFPESILAGQPAVDIVSLQHQVAGVDVSMEFTGEVFEMEDQRNWSDASYKTYCRPLAMTRPYLIRAGETLTQSIRIRLSGQPTAAVDDGAVNCSPIDDVKTIEVPDFLFALEPDWFPLAEEPANEILCLAAGFLLRFVDEQSWSDQQLKRIADLTKDSQQYCDLEIVLPDGVDGRVYLQALAQRLTTLGIAPRHVVALPAAWLVSHQPDGPWPDGTTPEECVRAAQSAFANSRIGIGMLSNFTELNRYPPEPGLGAYITHGTTAIVHAADDLSVLETLEALPHIFASAQGLAHTRAYRLGLVAIGMRSNPYGSGVAPNPDGRRVPMAISDPRQSALLGGVFAVAAIACAAEAGCEALAVGSPAGPFALSERVSPLRVWPLFHAIKALSGMRGNPLVELHGVSFPLCTYCLAVRCEDGRIRGLIANASLDSAEIDLVLNTVSVKYLDSTSYATATKDIDWLNNAENQLTQVLNLEPCAIAFFDLQEQ